MDETMHKIQQKYEKIFNINLDFFDNELEMSMIFSFCLATCLSRILEKGKDVEIFDEQVMRQKNNLETLRNEIRKYAQSCASVWCKNE